jgi:hypothetical protein
MGLDEKDAMSESVTDLERLMLWIILMDEDMMDGAAT